MRSLIPSAMLWAQPCQPPTRIGPKRTWMWALIFRSHQTINMTEMAVKMRTAVATASITINWGTNRGMPLALKAS